MSSSTNLKDALFPFKESSKSAIADADCSSFDEIKKYLHLYRAIEEQLKHFIELVKVSNSKKLFLVCGNVGDGKSHLLASIRLNNPNLLDGMKLHDDATESSKPDASFIDELNQLLEGFSDEKLNSGNEKIILAINLGTLNNFLEADGDNRFSKLKAYVKEKRILEVGGIVDCEFEERSPFQFVNFCDHNLFTLNEEGPKSNLIESAIEKVVSKDGPFYEAYENQKERHPHNCPICFNFELLRDPEFRDKISSLLIECIIKGELIVSIRALYNFIYDLIVPIDLQPLDDVSCISRIKQYSDSDFLQNIIPNYIFIHPELSHIFEQLQSYDPASSRGAKVDEAVTELMVSESPEKIVDRYISLDGMAEKIKDIFKRFKINRGYTDYISSFIRTVYFWPKTSGLFHHNDIYQEFTRLLYDWYSGEKKTVKPLYVEIQKAALLWKGQAEEGKINVDIGRQQLQYRASEKISIKPDPPDPPQSNDDQVFRFNAFVPLRFIIDSSSISIAITYHLYVLIRKINNGYRPTKLDHSNFAVFNDFVKRVSYSGEGHKAVFFTDCGNSKHQFALELDGFGDFCFRKVAG